MNQAHVFYYVNKIKCVEKRNTKIYENNHKNKRRKKIIVVEKIIMIIKRTKQKYRFGTLLNYGRLFHI